MYAPPVTEVTELMPAEVIAASIPYALLMDSEILDRTDFTLEDLVF